MPMSISWVLMGINKHDIDYVEQEKFGPRALRVNLSGTATGTFRKNQLNTILDDAWTILSQGHQEQW